MFNCRAVIIKNNSSETISTFLYTSLHTEFREASGQQVATLTVEADGADVSEQLLAVDVGHAGAEPGVAVAELAVHTVQGVGHGVHGVHHELDLALLLVAGVASHLLQACEGKTGRQERGVS